MGTTEQQIEALKQRKAKLDKQIAEIKAKEASQTRKEETRLKVLIGAAMLADSKINAKTAGLVHDVVARAIAAPRDRAFLQSKGWLKDEKTDTAAATENANTEKAGAKTAEGKN